jgi:hypothetical protein
MVSTTFIPMAAESNRNENMKIRGMTWPSLWKVVLSAFGASCAPHSASVHSGGGLAYTGEAACDNIRTLHTSRTSGTATLRRNQRGQSDARWDDRAAG